jgi:bifunctional DNase/RNase
MSDELCPVELRGLAEDRLQFEFVLLVDGRGRRLPIWIGKCEAIAIQLKLQGLGVARPMTHDLLCNSVERLGGRVTRLLIDDFWQSMFYAKLCLEVEGSTEEMQVDCRPSDGLAMAVRLGVPILVRDDVLEEGCIPAHLFDEPDEDVDDTR